MATKQDFEIEKGRTSVIVDTITGVDDWTEVLAKLNAVYRLGDTPDIELVGTVYPETDQVSFAFAASDTADLTYRNLHYEIVLYKTDKSFVRNPTSGIIKLITPVDIDPTI